MKIVELFLRSVCKPEHYQYKGVKWASTLLGYNRWEECMLPTGKGANGWTGLCCGQKSGG